MKKAFLVAGIIFMVLALLSLLYAALNMFGYYHVLDGSTSLYHRLHNRMIFFLLSLPLLRLSGQSA